MGDPLALPFHVKLTAGDSQDRIKAKEKYSCTLSIHAVDQAMFASALSHGQSLLCPGHSSNLSKPAFPGSLGASDSL